MQRGENTDDLQSQSKAKRARVEVAVRHSQEAHALRDNELGRIGNYVHESVPISNDEVQSLIASVSYLEQ